MRRTLIYSLPVVAVLMSGAAFAQEAKPIDLATLNEEELSGLLGPWQISDADDKRHCKVVLKQEQTIGGAEIEVDPGCAKVFPIMDEITAWRLTEGWSIDLVDAVRHTRVHFETPDDSYVAFPDVDGIFTIERMQSE